MRGIRVVGAIWCLLAAGCYSTVAVLPDELVKLNNSYNNSTSDHCSPGTSTVGPGGVVQSSPGVCTPGAVDESVRHLIRPDGRMVEIKGEASAIVKTRAGEYEFKHPVLVQRAGRKFIVRGSNAALTFYRADILGTEVKQPAPGKSALAAGLTGLLLSLVIFAAID